MKNALALLTLLALVLALCTACPVGDDDDDSALPEDETFDIAAALADYLSGEFDSSQQAGEDAQYFEIQLITCAVEAPELGERVLYVEQAAMDTPTQPYRQRLYVLHGDADSGTAGTVIYELAAPGQAIGLCDDDEVASFEAADAVERPGCGVELDWSAEEEEFEGGTVGQECLSDYGGASYATSEILLTGDRIESWDRGFDATDSQVWGATAGPYRFDRR